MSAMRERARAWLYAKSLINEIPTETDEGIIDRLAAEFEQIDQEAFERGVHAARMQGLDEVKDKLLATLDRIKRPPATGGEKA